MLCSKCVLPESPPDIRLDDRGVCNICRAEQTSGPAETRRKLLETDFVKILKITKGKHKYDCLVMCSGGKDSTAGLYDMKKRYGMNVLAFTFDHGFEIEDALTNVKNAVEILDVDFLHYRSSFLKDVFARIVSSRSPAVMCHICSIWYMQLTFEIARRYDIPLIVAGWTKGQTERVQTKTKRGETAPASEFGSMAKATQNFLMDLRKDPKYKNFPTSIDEVIRLAGKKHKSMVISPHWYLDREADEYVDLISRELNWKYPKLSYPAKSTNCLMNFLSVHRSLKHFGFTHYHVEASNLVRMGVLSRDEALKMLEINYDKELINSIGEILGIENIYDL